MRICMESRRTFRTEILALGGTGNHVHILAALPAAKTLSDVRS